MYPSPSTGSILHGTAYYFKYRSGLSASQHAPSCTSAPSPPPCLPPASSQRLSISCGPSPHSLLLHGAHPAGPHNRRLHRLTARLSRSPRQSWPCPSNYAKETRCNASTWPGGQLGLESLPRTRGAGSHALQAPGPGQKTLPESGSTHCPPHTLSFFLQPTPLPYFFGSLSTLCHEVLPQDLCTALSLCSDLFPPPTSCFSAPTLCVELPRETSGHTYPFHSSLDQVPCVCVCVSAYSHGCQYA